MNGISLSWTCITDMDTSNAKKC